MTRYLIFIGLAFYISCTNAQQNKQSENNIKDPSNSSKEKGQVDNKFKCNYLGETPPNDLPIKFGANVISTSKDESALEISSDGKIIIFARAGGIYMLNFDENSGLWSEPKLASFSDANDGECCFSTDGNKIYFNSLRPVASSNRVTNIWISEKENGKWKKAYFSGLSMEGKNVHAISVSANGNVYTDGIIKIEKKINEYLPYKKLAANLAGSHVFISPDESYILFDKRVNYKKSIFISFSKNDGTWTEPIILNDKINSGNNSGNPFITPDGKYLFFMRNFDIYWVKADFIENLRPKN